MGTPSYTSGDQLCNGEAAILNKKPTKIKIKPRLNPSNTYPVFTAFWAEAKG